MTQNVVNDPLDIIDDNALYDPAGFVYSAQNTIEQNRHIRKDNALSLPTEQRYEIILMLDESQESSWWAQTWLLYATYIEVKNEAEGKDFYKRTYEQIVENINSLSNDPAKIAQKLGVQSTIQQRIKIASWLDELEIDENDYPFVKHSYYYEIYAAGKDKFLYWLKKVNDDIVSGASWTSRTLRSHIQQEKDESRGMGTGSADSVTDENNIVVGKQFVFQKEWAECKTNTDLSLQQIRELLQMNDLNAALNEMSELGKIFSYMFDVLKTAKRESQNDNEN